jgi:hypothetical protein
MSAVPEGLVRKLIASMFGRESADPFLDRWEPQSMMNALERALEAYWDEIRKAVLDDR